MTGNSSAWMFSERKGVERMRQVTDTRLLRLKVEVWYRPWRSFLRRWVAR